MALPLESGRHGSVTNGSEVLLRVADIEKIPFRVEISYPQVHSNVAAQQVLH
jgi:hypothetical protein